MLARYLIFGGAGFIGSHLARSLAQRGHSVDVADIAERPKFSTDSVVYHHCDVRDPIDVAMCDCPDVVVNLAAVHRTPGHPDHEYHATNVPGARNVTDYCERVGCTEIWFTSSISVYGPSEEPLTESAELRHETAYGASKAEAERIHRAWQAQSGGRRLIIVRPAVIFGRGEGGNFARMAHLVSRGFFIYPGRRDTIKGCGYVEELITSLEFMSRQPDALVTYNFAYPTPYTIANIVKTVSEATHRQVHEFTIPMVAMLAAAIPFEILNRLGVRNAIHRDRVRKLTKSTYVVPKELISREYAFETDLSSGVERWLADESMS